MTRNEFYQELKSLGIELTDEQNQQLEKYYQLLIFWNEKVNLTRITQKEAVYEKHFYDSLTLIKAVDLRETNTLLDIGTGAGFPGIVLKIVFPNLKITLLDSLQKRVNFLNKVIEELELKEIDAIHNRAEDYQKDNKKYDVVTSRAVAKLSKLIEYAIPFVSKQGTFIAMKANIDKEVEEGQVNLKKYHCKVDKIIAFKLPKEKSIRNLIIIKKV